MFHTILANCSYLSKIKEEQLKKVINMIGSPLKVNITATNKQIKRKIEKPW